MLMLAIAVLLLADASLASPQDQHHPSPQQPHEHAAASEPEPPPAHEASGTAWVPSFSPMYGFHRTASGWDFMVHGNVFAQFLYESGEEHRRSQQFGSINWLMGMGSRSAGGGRLSARAMLSFEPWTIGGCGYPNLTATGEICRGDSIHDLQHPHDLFMELALAYERPLAPNLRWHVYGGPVGEPALGPVAFPHRLSGFPNPVAPTTHHWLDSTHITFGVVTAGFSGPRWRVEGSVFNGREPDSDRTDLDLAGLDSFSGRVSLTPTARLSLQASAGRLREAESGLGSLPPTDIDRVTASVMYHRPFGSGGILALTAAYGVNSKQSVVPGAILDQATHAGLLEGSAIFAERQTFFGRIELVGKPAHDLHIHEHITSVFTVGKLQGGYIRHLGPMNGLLAGIGGSVSAALVPPLLAPRYGGRIAPGAGVFVTIRPTANP